MKIRQTAIIVAVVLGALLALQIFNHWYVSYHVRLLFDLFALAFAFVIYSRIAPARTLRGEMGRFAFGVLFFALARTASLVIVEQIASDLLLAGRVGWLLLARAAASFGLAWSLLSAVRLGGLAWMRRRRRVVIAVVITAALVILDSPSYLIWIAGIYIILAVVPLHWTEEMTGRWGWSAIGMLVLAPLALIVFGAQFQINLPEGAVTTVRPIGVPNLNVLLDSPLLATLQRYLLLYWVMIPLRITASFFQGNFGLRIPISLKLAMTYFFSTVIPGILLLLLLVLTVYLGIGTMRARMVRNLIYEDLNFLEKSLIDRNMDAFSQEDSVAIGLYVRTTLVRGDRPGIAPVPQPPSPTAPQGRSFELSSDAVTLSTTPSDAPEVPLIDPEKGPEEVWVLLSQQPSRLVMPDTLPVFPGWSDTTIARNGILPLGAGRSAFAAAMVRSQKSRIVNVALRPFNQRALNKYREILGVEISVAPHTGLSLLQNAAGSWRAEVLELDDPRWSRMEYVATEHADEIGMFNKSMVHGFSELQIWSGEEEHSSRTQGLITVSTSFTDLMSALYASTGVNRVTLLVLLALAVLLLLAVVFSSVLGFGITRSVTTSVHSLRVGTEHLRQGDLDTKIEVKSRDELGDLASSFNRMTTDLKRMISEVGEKERLEREIQIARQIQIHLLPAILPETERLKIAGRSDPALEVGGDYYDAFELAEGGILLALGDVSGKGVGAAILMSNLQANLHVLGTQRLPLEQIASELNQQIYRNSTPEMFITCFLARVDCPTMTMSYVNAGHDRPVLLRNGSIESLDKGGLLLGVNPDAKYNAGTVDLTGGDLLAVYSDGLTEAMDAMDVEYGRDRLIETIKFHKDKDAWEVVDSIMRSVRTYAGDERAARDDLTMMVVKVT